MTLRTLVSAFIFCDDSPIWMFLASTLMRPSVTCGPAPLSPSPGERLSESFAMS
jgi:hypothetical protein